MNIAEKNTQLNVFILYEPDNRFDYATKPEHDNKLSNKKKFTPTGIEPFNPRHPY